jgi:FkbM family methyltransferase
MADDPTTAEWGRLFGAVETAARLAPLGGRRPDSRPSLSARAWSRVRSAAALLLTARQKRFNLESAAALDELARAVTGLRVELADVRAELALLRSGLSPPEHYRPRTKDQLIWYTVNVLNEYRLPPAFDPRDMILDVGAHIGAFAFACFGRGAGLVVAFEPSPENAPLLRGNLSRFGPRARVVQAAVWRSDRPAGTLAWVPSTDPANTGGGEVSTAGGAAVEAVPFDDALAQALARTGAERVRLLKLDCEGSEYPILLTSRKLHLIDQVCGEFHEPEHPVSEAGRVGGWERYDRDDLRRCLEGAGFRVEFETADPGARVGLFFATRS